MPFLGADGRPVQFVAIRADITERKVAEESLRQSQKLESLGVLAGGIAHDFNNLLTSILGNCNLAAMVLPQDSPAQPYLDQIEKATMRAADLSRQMLAYAGKGKVAIGRVNMNRLVQEMTELLSVSLSKKVADPLRPGAGAPGDHGRPHPDAAGGHEPGDQRLGGHPRGRRAASSPCAPAR